MDEEFSVLQASDEIRDLTKDLDTDYFKFDENGNKKASIRIRNNCKTIMKLAKGIAAKVLEERKERGL